jgi:hypothetical protein
MGIDPFKMMSSEDFDDGKVLIMECCGYISALKWERMTPNCGESYRKIS